MGKPRVQISKEELEKLYYKNNLSAVQLGVIFNCSSTTIKNYLVKYDMRIKTSSEVMTGRKLSEEHRNKVVKTLAIGRKGYENPNWKGGKVSIGRKKHGQYIAIRSEGRYYPEHRYNMEQYLGRKLSRWEEVHHINGNKQDNRIENLQIMSKSDHAKLHNNNPEYKKRKSDTMKKIRKQKFWSTSYKLD